MAKLYGLRYIFGELILLVAIFFSLMPLIPIFDMFYQPEINPLTIDRLRTAARNFGIALLLFFFSRLVRYNELPIKGNSNPNFQAEMLKCFGKGVKRVMANVILSLLTIFVAFDLLSIMLIWHPDDLETIFVGILPMFIPALIISIRMIGFLTEAKMHYGEKSSFNTLVPASIVNSTDVYPRNLEFIRPKLTSWLLYLALIAGPSGIMIAAMGSSSYFFMILMISLIGALISWKILSPFIFSLLILNPLRRIKSGKKLRFLNRRGLGFLGIDLSDDNQIYVESEVKTIDLNNVRKTISRMFELITSGLAIVFISLSIYGYENYMDRFNDPYLLLTELLILLMMGPIILGFIIPVVWSIEDFALKSVDEDNNISLMSDNVRGGLLNRIFGISGLISSLSFLYQYHLYYPELTDREIVNQSMLMVDSAVLLIYLAGLFAGPSLAFGLLYLIIIHPKMVRNLRSKIIPYIPVAATFTRIATEMETNTFDNYIKQ
ncbi:MAG: hypothetical protein INQ03_19985 [Candidatus Heimdallarchaeota archaeon]|nr:hypothetical protein [Candidatus Heimdallarchaeota archaeon]